jgi:PKD repeat protein
MAVTPDGKSLYATNPNGTDVLQYDIAPGGGLAPKTPPGVTVGMSHFWIAVRPDQSPAAAFAVGAAAAGQATSFDASGSSDPDGGIARFDWDFGDGASAANGGPKPTHVYGQPGTYTAKLTVTDDQGCSAPVFTGLTALCNGSAATATQAVSVGVPAGGPAPIVFPVGGSSAFAFVALTATRGGTITAVIDTQAGGDAAATASTRVRAKKKKKKRARRSAKKSKVKTVAWGSGTASTAGAGRVTLRIPAGRAAAAALRRTRKLKVAVAITFTATGGAPEAHTRNVTVKAPKKRAKHKKKR